MTSATRTLFAPVRFAWRRPVGALGLLVVLAFVAIAAFADRVATHDPIAQDIPNRLEAPSRVHYFGTDGFGRDVFSRMVHGARVSVRVGLTATLVAVLLGAVIGVTSGYASGRFDLVVQRLVDTLMAFPPFVLALVVVAALGPNVNNVLVAIATAFAPQAARLARTEVLSLKGETYVLAARVNGAGPLRTIFRHIIPNGWSPLLVLATAFFGEAIVVEAALSYFGLGVPPPLPSWGRVLQDGLRRYLEVAPWLTLFPVLALCTVVFAFTAFADALRDHFDPLQR